MLDRDQFLEQAHDRHWKASARCMDLRISRLRAKIEATLEKPETIKTVRGFGCLCDPT